MQGVGHVILISIGVQSYAVCRLNHVHWRVLYFSGVYLIRNAITANASLKFSFTRYFHLSRTTSLVYNLPISGLIIPQR